jgi:hypothetical protein
MVAKKKVVKKIMKSTSKKKVVNRRKVNGSWLGKFGQNYSDIMPVDWKPKGLKRGRPTKAVSKSVNRFKNKIFKQQRSREKEMNGW